MRVAFWQCPTPLLATVTGFILTGSGISSFSSSQGFVIHEIMYAPRSGEPEWVEFYNGSSTVLDVKGWTIEDSDSTKPRLLTRDPLKVAPYGYIIVAQDLSDFLNVHPEASCPVFKPLSGWPRLNNDGDRVVVRDSTRALIDGLTYDEKWGGQEGKSLERINPHWPSDCSESWSTSVAPAQSTPCAQNSIHASSFVGRARLSVDPDPFETQTTISYALTVPTATVKLLVYDIRGRLVATLIDEEPSGSTGSIVWAGRDTSGKRLRAGIYVLYLEAINAQTGTLDRAKVPVTLATKLD